MKRSDNPFSSGHLGQLFNIFRINPASDEANREFLEMLDKGQHTLFKVCLLFTDRSYDSVRDLYQDIVYNLWKNWPRFRHQSSATTWLYRIALNTAISDHRRRRHTPTLVTLDESVAAMLADEDENSKYTELYRLIDRLDDGDKEVTFLYLDKLPLKEIAQITDTTEDAVKQRIRRIKNKLKTIKENET